MNSKKASKDEEPTRPGHSRKAIRWGAGGCLGCLGFAFLVSLSAPLSVGTFILLLLGADRILGLSKPPETKPLSVAACQGQSSGQLTLLPSLVPGAELTSAVWKASREPHRSEGTLSYQATFQYPMGYPYENLRVIFTTDKPGPLHVVLSTSKGAEPHAVFFPAEAGKGRMKQSIEAKAYINGVRNEVIAEIPPDRMNGCPKYARLVLEKDYPFVFGIKEAFYQDSASILKQVRQATPPDPTRPVNTPLPRVTIFDPADPSHPWGVSPGSEYAKAHPSQHSWSYLWPWVGLVRLAYNATDSTLKEGAIVIMTEKQFKPTDTLVIPISKLKPREAAEILVPKINSDYGEMVGQYSFYTRPRMDSLHLPPAPWRISEYRKHVKDSLAMERTRTRNDKSTPP